MRRYLNRFALLVAGIESNLPGLWYPKLPLLRGGFASNFDHCPFDISLYHPPDALGVLSQRATLVGLIIQSGKPTIATEPNKNSTRWVLFFVWLRGQESNLRPPGYEGFQRKFRKISKSSHTSLFPLNYNTFRTFLKSFPLLIRPVSTTSHRGQIGVKIYDVR